MNLMDYLRQQAALPEELRDKPLPPKTPEQLAAERADFERRLQEDIDANNARIAK